MQWAAVFMAIALAVVVRRGTGTFAHPAALFAAYWALLLFMLTAVFTQLYAAPRASWFILGAIFGAALSAPIGIKALETNPSHISTPGWLGIFVGIATVAIFSATLISQMANGISLASIVSFDTLGAAARDITKLRYEGGLKSPALSTILLGVGYAGAMIAPFAALQKSGAWRIATLAAPAIAAGYYAMATTARAPFLIATVITLASWLVTWAIKEGGRPTLHGRQGAALLLAATGVLATFTLVAFVRVGHSSVTADALVRGKLGIYSVGSIVGLDTGLPEASPLHFGGISFEGILSPLEPNSSLYSGHANFVEVGPGMESNVYTSLWDLFQDFGMAGAILVSTLLVLLGAAAFRFAILNRSVGAAVFCIGWMSYLLFSQTNTIFAFTNVCFGFTLGSIVIVRFVKFQELPVRSGGQLVAANSSTSNS